MREKGSSFYRYMIRLTREKASRGDVSGSPLPQRLTIDRVSISLDPKHTSDLSISSSSSSRRLLLSFYDHDERCYMPLAPMAKSSSNSHNAKNNVPCHITILTNTLVFLFHASRDTLLFLADVRSLQRAVVE